MSSPTVDNWADVEHILCYLKRAPRRGFLYSNHGHSRVECFTNVDWAGSKEDRRSTSGYCVFVCGNLVSRKINKQGVVSHQVQSQNIEQWYSLCVKSCGFINS